MRTPEHVCRLDKSWSPVSYTRPVRKLIKKTGKLLLGNGSDIVPNTRIALYLSDQWCDHTHESVLCRESAFDR